MVISIWRYSHFLLAVSSAVFLILASVTGAILAVKPISEHTKSYSFSNLDAVSLAQTLEALREEYSEVLALEVTHANAVKASVITKNDQNQTIYVHPLTGKKIADVEKVAPLYRWVTSFHRSLFLKGIGRFFVGLVAFILCVIAITGLILVGKRQGGILKVFSKVRETEFNERYHVVLGRWFLIPILAIALTGVFLSAEKFSLLPEAKISHNYNFEGTDVHQQSDILEFEVFKTTKLNALRSLAFPFSSDAEDYFEVALQDRELLIQQYTGTIASEVAYPFVQLASAFSLKWHTGQGSILWSVVLLLSSLSILFFIYSGLSLSVKRIRNSRVSLTSVDKDECDIVLLVGSETGNTFVFAKAFGKALVKAGNTVFLSSLNEYTTYKKAQQLIVFTATYGDGDAPSNATYFESLFEKIKPMQPLQFAVVGFGSKLYPNFCEFAIKADALLHSITSFKPLLPLTKIDDQSESAFEAWVAQWSAISKIKLQLKGAKAKTKAITFKVVERTNLNTDDTFLLHLQSKKPHHVQSGDLLGIIPEYETKERLYSIAQVNNTIVLSIKKHQKGICSTQLSQLKPNAMLTATLKENTTFHFPKDAKKVLMIANGTGIAPFLGMINSDLPDHVNTYLFWGGRTKASFKLYADLIDKAFYKQNLSGLFVSFSKEDSQRKYVQHALIEKADLVCRILEDKGVLMICGSLAMKNDVLITLDGITKAHFNRSITEFESTNQILTDCY